MQLTKNFSLQELVPDDVFAELGDKAVDLLDPRLAPLVQFFRDKWGPTVVNNWHVFGQYKESGYRKPNSKTGAKNSMHKQGKAADLKFTNHSPQEVYAHIMTHKQEYIDAGLTCVENVTYTPTWLHIDIRDHANAGKDILVVNP